VNSRPRILSIIDDVGFAGGEARLLTFCRTIDRNRFTHTLLTIQGADPLREQQWAMRQQFAKARVEVREMGDGSAHPRPKSRKQIRIFRAASRLLTKVRELCREIRDLKIDLVDAHMEPANLIGVLAGRFTGVPVVVTAYHPKPLVPYPFWRMSGQFTLSTASVVVTDSRASAEEIRRWIVGPKPRILVIPNGLDHPSTECTKSECRRLMGLPTDPAIRVIGQVAGLVEYKGQLVLLEAARRVMMSEPNTIFLIVGYARTDLDYKARLERRASELGIAPKTRIVSYPGPIGDAWSVIDIHVHASLFDSLPNAIMEAMSLRKPSVVTAVGGVPEMVEDRSTGFVVPPNDPVSLADALVRLLRDPEFAMKLGDAAFRRYLQRYTPQVMTRALEHTFLQLLS
jgi:L-malate glycosyltransferase